MKRYLEYIYMLGIFCFLQSCAQEIKDREEIQVKTEYYVLPPIAGNCLDSIKIAFENAAQVSGCGEIHFNSDLFLLDYNPLDDAVVKAYLNQYPIRILVSEKLIRQYSWHGYLLIALHEWYHIYINSIDNDEAHEAMVHDHEYHKWIQRTFNCTLETARWLAYIGTENTPVYDSLTEQDKQLVEYYQKKYNIKL